MTKLKLYCSINLRVFIFEASRVTVKVGLIRAVKIKSFFENLYEK